MKPSVKVLLVCSACVFGFASGFGPPLQLETEITDLTNVVKDRDYEELYDAILPKDSFKGQVLKPAERLERRIIPLHYNLKIRPIIDEDNGEAGKRFTAPGEVEIHFRAVETTDMITLHAVELDITSVKIHSRESDKFAKSVRIHSKEYAKEDSVYRIKLQEVLEPDTEHKLALTFNSRVANDRLVGLYFTNFTDPSTNKVHYIATTQFESTHARKAFPCFDEPDLKATFAVSVGRKAHYNSVSNMELLNTEPIAGLEGWFWDNYKTTLKMSTYLLAFIVSEHAAEEIKFEKRTVKTWAPKHLIEKQSGVYATHLVGRVLDFYDEYFQLAYPLPKMDSVAIPHFRAGAMENWGLNTYRYQSLLYTKNQTTESERFKITSTVTHELAHQNFGNLVTCKRWQHVWLNEGFATYVSYLGMSKAAPEFKAWDYFYSRETTPAMRFDSTPATHALVNDTPANAQSTGDFDKISYDKGASLLLMMRGFLGEETMQKLLQVYLRKFAYKNAVTDDFITEADSIAAIEERLPKGLTIKTIMEGYLYQPGFPLVRVSLEKLNPTRLYLSQERFLTNRTTDKNDLSRWDLWWIPASIKFSSKPDFHNSKPDIWLPNDVIAKQWKIPRTVLHPKVSSNVSVESNQPYDWVLVNPVGHGYYRVIYDETLTKMLHKQLDKDHTVFPPVTRAKLIEDYFTAAKAEYVPYSSALGFTNYLSRETDHNVWSVALLNVKRIHNMMRDGKRFDLFTSYFQPKVVGALKTIGYEQQIGETGPEVILRANLLDWACNMGHRECLQYAKRLFKAWVDAVKQGQDKNPIPADILPVVLCTAISTASHLDKNQLFLFLWNQYKKELNPFAKTKLIESMACSQDKKHLNFIIENALNTTSKVGAADATVVLQRIAASSIGRRIIMDRMDNNLESFINRFGGPEQIGYIITAISVYANTGNQLLALQSLLEKNPKFFEPIIKMALAAISNALSNLNWVSKFENVIASWFETRVSEVTADLIIF